MSHGHLEAARLLLEAGARIDQVNELDHSALGLCSPNGFRPNPDMFRLLRSYWPDVTPEDTRR